MLFRKTSLYATVLFVAGFVLPAYADDRPPTADEKTAIESALKGLGFSEWKKIELDDDKWEIDDAVHSDGNKYKVKLDFKSLAVLKQEIDD
jgi:uncharacterized membrane protein YkoI